MTTQEKTAVTRARTLQALNATQGQAWDRRNMDAPGHGWRSLWPFNRREDNPYTQLAYDARRGRSHLRADELLPNDVIEAEGILLTVERVLPALALVTLDFVELSDWRVTYKRTELVRVVLNAERYLPAA